MKKILIILILLTAATSNAQWVQQYTGGGGGQVSAVSDITAWCVGSDQLMFRTTNGGDTWHNVGWTYLAGGGKTCLWAFDGYSAVVAVHTQNDSNHIYKTTNAGLNWSVKLKGPRGSSLLFTAIKFRNSTDGFIVAGPTGNRYYMWRTTNAGETWDSTGLYLAGTGGYEHSYNLLWYTGNTVMLGAKGLGIYHSTNNGGNWVLRVLPGTAPVNPAAIWFTDANTGYTGGNNDLLKTTNGGVNWSIIPNTNGPSRITAILVSGSTIWFTRDASDYIYYSVDNGVTWSFKDVTQNNGYSSTMYKSRTGSYVWAGFHRGIFNGAP